MAAAARDLRGEDAAPRGLLMVTAPVVFGRMRILPIVNQLLKSHPDLRIRLMLTDRLVRLAEEGLDLAVRIAPLADSSLKMLRLTEVRRTLAATPAYLARRGTPRSVEELANHDLIVCDPLAPTGEWRFGGPGRPVLRLTPRLQTSSVEAAIDATLDDLGIVRTLSYQTEDLVAAGRLVPVLPEHDPPSVPVQLVYLAHRQRSPNVRAFVEAARSAFASGVNRRPEDMQNTEI